MERGEIVREYFEKSYTEHDVIKLVNFFFSLCFLAFYHYADGLHISRAETCFSTCSATTSDKFPKTKK